MDCRSLCGACCTAPSITSPIPGMPNGEPAGVRCVQLGDDEPCRIFGQPERPRVAPDCSRRPRCAEPAANMPYAGYTRWSKPPPPGIQVFPTSSS